MLVLVLAGVGAVVIALAVKLFKGLANGSEKTQDSRIIQEVYRGLTRLEERIDALETILLDRKREGRNK
jgi:phage shock protein B